MNTADRSSNISRVEYDPVSRQLDISFKSGGIYRYHDVHPATHLALVTHQSLGKAYNDLIRAKHKSETIRGPQERDPKELT
jgi:KTSC domain-containing protein